MRKGKSAEPQGEWLSMEQVASIFKCGRNTFKRRIAEGKTKGLIFMDPFGTGKIVVSKKSVDDFISKRMQETAKHFKLAPSFYEHAAPAK